MQGNNYQFYSIWWLTLISKALQPEIIQNKVGKFIPYIFMEWIHIHENCPNYNIWVENFNLGGYISVDPGKYEYRVLLAYVLKFQQNKFCRYHEKDQDWGSLTWPSLGSSVCHASGIEL